MSIPGQKEKKLQDLKNFPNIMENIWDRLDAPEKKNLCLALHTQCPTRDCQGHTCPHNPMRPYIEKDRPETPITTYCPLCQVQCLGTHLGGPCPEGHDPNNPLLWPHRQNIKEYLLGEWQLDGTYRYLLTF